MVIHQGQFSAARIWPIAMKAFFGTVIFYSSYRLKFITFRVPSPLLLDQAETKIIRKPNSRWIIRESFDFIISRKYNSDDVYSYIYSILCNLIIIIIVFNHTIHFETYDSFV